MTGVLFGVFWQLWKQKKSIHCCGYFFPPTNIEGVDKKNLSVLRKQVLVPREMCYVPRNVCGAWTLFFTLTFLMCGCSNPMCASDEAGWCSCGLTEVERQGFCWQSTRYGPTSLYSHECAVQYSTSCDASSKGSAMCCLAWINKLCL